MIESVIWTDLYKLTMAQAVSRRYPEVGATYEFIDRGNTLFPEGFAYKLQEQIKRMSELRIKPREREKLEEKTPFLRNDYLKWLENFQYDPKEVDIDQVAGSLFIGIKGLWKRTIYWEVPLMTTISELYFQETGQRPDLDFIQKAINKGQRLKEAGVKFMDFGTRRAFSTMVHEKSLGGLIEGAGLIADGGSLLGTSNVALGFEYNIPVSGTYAHEWIMAHAAMFGNLQANAKAMEVWADEYLGRDGGDTYSKLGTALMDTYTTDAFLPSFSPELARFYTYGRQDSGKPEVEAMKFINHLRQIGIDPKTKGVVFSDALDTDKAIWLHNMFKDIIQVVFGIGTHFTNDVGVKPLNIVIKVRSFVLPDGREVPVCKLSDDRGKESGDPLAIEKAKKDFGIN